MRTRKEAELKTGSKPDGRRRPGRAGSLAGGDGRGLFLRGLFGLLGLQLTVAFLAPGLNERVLADFAFVQSLLCGGTLREPFLAGELGLDVHVLERALGDGLERGTGGGAAVTAADRGIIAGHQEHELRIFSGDESDERGVVAVGVRAVDD